MANAYSIVKRQTPYIQPYDLSSIEKTLAIKEGRYNANVAQVNQAISQFSSIDLIRDKDKGYLYNNLKKVVSILDNTDNIDFSRTGLGSELGRYISQAVDKNVLKQAANTKTIRNYNAGIAEMREKNPELYSSINDQDARIQSGYYQYLDGQSDELGNMNYVNFTDVQANVIKKAKELKDLRPDSIMKVPDGKGHFIEKSVKGLTQSEWLKVLPTLFTEQDRAQLAINGRVRYGYNNEAAVSDINRLKTVNNENLKRSLDAIDAKMDLIVDDSTRDELKKERKQIEDYYKKSNASYDLVGNTAGKIGGFLLEQELVSGLASTLGATENIKYSEDASYWKRLKQNASDKSKLVGQNQFRDRNLDLAPDIFTTATPVQTGDIGNVLKLKEDSQKELEKNFSRKLTSIYNSFDETTKKKVDTIEKQVLREHEEKRASDSTLKPLTELELHREVIDRVSLGDNALLSLQDKIDLKSDMDQIDAYNTAKSEAFDVAENNLFSKNSEEIYEELTSNPEILMFGLESGPITFNEFLQRKQIESGEDLATFLSTDSPESNAFRANFLVQTSDQLNSIGINLYRGPGRFSIGDQPGDQRVLLNRDLIRRLQRAKELLGEEAKSLDEIFTTRDIVTQQPISLEDLREDNIGSISIADPDSKLAQLLYNTSATKVTAPVIGLDRSLRQESHIYNEFKQNKFTEEYERALNLKTANITGQNIVTIQPSLGKDRYVPEYQELITKAQAIGLVGLDTKLPINLTRNVDGTFSIFQNQEGKDDPVEVKIGTISQRELAQLPELRNSLLLEESKSFIEFNTRVRSEVPLLNYLSSSAKNSRELQNVFNANTPQGVSKIMMASKDNVLQYLGNTLPRMNKKEKGPEYVSMVKNVLRNPNKFSLKMDTFEGISNVVVQMINQEGEKIDIDSIDLSNNIDQREFLDIYYAAPQIFLTLALQNIGTEYLSTNDSSKIELINNNL